ncbi:MAG: zinc-dependent metalloproteinase lipoprotein [Bacteroides sp.]
MKTSTLLFALSVILSLISCTVGTVGTEDSESLDLSTSVFTAVSNNDTNLKVTVTCSSAWTAASDALWCMPQTLNGSGVSVLILNVGANLESTNRQATITLQAGTATKTITVQQLAGRGTAEGYHYKLPVIFHVLYKDKNDPRQNVSAKRLANILAKVNAYYQGGSNSADMNLEFVLATRDANGRILEEPGVDRVPMNSATLDCEEFMSSKKRKYTYLLWDPNQYINVMMYNFASAGEQQVILGISHYPYTWKTHSLEGVNESQYPKITLAQLDFAYCVSINSLFINKESQGEIHRSDDVNVTLAHELGHYLGLLHTFSQKKNGDIDLCADTDYCKDTPTYNRAEYNQWLVENKGQTIPALKDVAIRHECGTGILFTSYNIMDYSYSYSNQFTPDQCERIRYILTYGILMPGPKLGQTGTRATSEETVHLPIRTIR